MTNAASFRAVVFAIWIAASARAQAAEPSVPAGLDPGGVAIALLGDGVDYTKPAVAKRLARDGEGDPIGWDFTDQDVRPYAASGQSNQDAERLIALSNNTRLVVIKGAPDDPVAIGRMAIFASQTPARILVCPNAMSRKDWPVALEAARRFPDRLFIVAQNGSLTPGWQAIPNLVFARQGSGWTPAVDPLELAVRAADLLTRSPVMSAADLKRALAK